MPGSPSRRGTELGLWMVCSEPFPSREYGKGRQAKPSWERDSGLHEPSLVEGPEARDLPEWLLVACR